MQNKESNNDFFSYEGTINRKDYAINMFILVAIFIGLSLIQFENFAPYIKYQFLYTTMISIAGFLKFVLLMATLSVIYRRITDTNKSNSQSYGENIKKLFALLFVFPVLYMYCIRFFIDFSPILRQILDMTVIFVLLPIGIIATIILGFIRGKQ